MMPRVPLGVGNAFYGKIVGFCGPGSVNDLIRFRPQQGGNGLCRPFHCRQCCLTGWVVGIGIAHKGLFRREKRIQHRCFHRRICRIVQIDHL